MSQDFLSQEEVDALLKGVTGEADGCPGGGPQKVGVALVDIGGGPSDIAIFTGGALALLGGVAARVGGADLTMGAMRVTFWGALAMAATAGIGKIFGTIV